MAPTASPATPASPGTPTGKAPRGTATRATLAPGRTCYDHLAGRLGIAVTDAMVRAGLLRRSEGFTLTDAGGVWLATVAGVDPAPLRATRRPLVRACLDWTERRPHLAGAVGAQLCRSFLDRGWVRRLPTGRAVRLTEDGAAALRQILKLDPAGLT